MRSTDFAEKIGTTKADIENWRSRPNIQLRTHYAETVAGSARKYSLDNIIELAVMAALVNIGCRPSSAAAYADMSIRNRNSQQVKEWLVFAAGDFSKGKGTNQLDVATIEEVANGTPSKSAALVHLGEIIRSVETMYSAHHGEES